MNFQNFFRFLCVVVLQQIVFSAFSINYQPHQGHEADVKLMNFGASFKDTPSAEQVADIYTRLSGKAPLLWEDQVNMPTVHAFQNSQTVASPLLVEVHGGVLPKSAVPAIRVPTSSEHVVPKLADVVATLQKNGMKPETKSFTVHGDNVGELHQLLAKQERPVIILHNDGHMDAHSHRLLQSTTNTTTVIPLNEFQISQYQICLWTGVLMVLLISSAICSVVQMEVIPDNILFAKFQTGKGEGKRE